MNPKKFPPREAPSINLVVLVLKVPQLPLNHFHARATQRICMPTRTNKIPKLVRQHRLGWAPWMLSTDQLHNYKNILSNIVVWYPASYHLSKDH